VERAVAVLAVEEGIFGRHPVVVRHIAE
jgi:hypothetical protein